MEMVMVMVMEMVNYDNKRNADNIDANDDAGDNHIIIIHSR